jgi:triphosphatase
MGNEIELKLRIAKSDVAHFKRQLTAMSKDMQISGPTTRKVMSTYYDTPSLILLHWGISLRLRRDARKWMQTIKSAGNAVNGLHQRIEIENEVANGQLDFNKFTNTVYENFLRQESLQHQIQPIFSTNIQRTEWQLSFVNGDQVELVLDIGDLIAGDKREPICEIELELKQGNAGRLFEIALQLQQHIPLWIENISKAHRGYAYYRPQQPSIVSANPAKLHRKMKASEALTAIVQECLTQLQGNQEMVLYGKDIEGVHQMRVALRRLRSALNVFGCVSSKQHCNKLITELKWITGVLGTARDLDVFTSQTLPLVVKQLQNESSLALLAKHARQHRLQAYTDTREALNAQRYQRLLLTLADWLANQRWQNEKLVKHRAGAVAQSILAKHYKKLKKSGKTLSQGDAKQRHATRIAAKKLRYAAEFFADFYPAKQSKLFLKSLAALQDQLGVMNDINVTNALIVKLIGAHPPRNLVAAHYLVKGWNAHQLLLTAQLSNTTWKQFSDQKPFWLT